MPVDAPADSADVHWFMWLHFSPTQLTVWNEFFVFVLFFRWEVVELNDLHFVCFDEVDLLAAVRTSNVRPPPSEKTYQAKCVSTFEDAKLTLVVIKTNCALIVSCLGLTDELFHPPSNPWSDFIIGQTGGSFALLTFAALCYCSFRT